MEWVIPAVAVLLLAWCLVTYNRLVALRRVATQAWADIEVELRRRHDLVPNLVETVKGHVADESKLLDAVIRARNQATLAQSPETIGKAEAALTSTIRRVVKLAKVYPTLKADAGFQQLKSRLSELEDWLDDARRFFNNSVQENNTSLGQLPAVLLADACGFKIMEFFALENSEREAAEVAPKVRR
ncbi:MAG: rane protein [Rubritepida sp.]|nr:rane protein [Rubritepida sp.]